MQYQLGPGEGIRFGIGYVDGMVCALFGRKKGSLERFLSCLNTEFGFGSYLITHFLNISIVSPLTIRFTAFSVIDLPAK